MEEALRPPPNLLQTGRVPVPLPKKLPPFGHGPRVPPLAGYGYFLGAPLSGIPCGFAVLMPARKVLRIWCSD